MASFCLLPSLYKAPARCRKQRGVTRKGAAASGAFLPERSRMSDRHFTVQKRPWRPWPPGSAALFSPYGRGNSGSFIRIRCYQKISKQICLCDLVQSSGFYYSDSRGYLIFYCYGVATNIHIKYQANFAGGDLLK